MQSEDVELRSRSKETKAQDGVNTVDVDSNDDGKSPTPSASRSHSHPYLSTDSQTRTRRLFSMSQLFAFSLTYMGTWEAWHQSIYSPLYNGGPRAIFWGGFLTVAGALAQAASIAEMSSLQPVAGAQYHWTYLLAPKSCNRFMCYLQGWASWFGYVALLAGVANTTAIQLEGIVQFNHENYVPGGWHTSVIVIALLVVLGALNMYAFRLVPWIELTGLLSPPFYYVDERLEPCLTASRNRWSPSRRELGSLHSHLCRDGSSPRSRLLVRGQHDLGLG